jgi:hypothetical protein
LSFEVNIARFSGSIAGKKGKIYVHLELSLTFVWYFYCGFYAGYDTILRMEKELSNNGWGNKFKNAVKFIIA